MKDEENNFSPKQPNENSRNPKEDIPLWLQGLEEETKANRLQAAKEETSIPDNDEAQTSFPSEPISDSHETSEMLIEEPEVEMEDNTSFEDQEDVLSPSESQTEEFIEIPEESPEAPALIEDEQSTEDDSHPTPWTVESTELTDAPSDEVETEKEDQSGEITPQNSSPVDQTSDSSETAEASFEELDIEKEFAVEDDTEKIAIPSPISENDHEDDLEWVNEITEIDIDHIGSEEDHTKPQNILDPDHLPADEEQEDSGPEIKPLPEEALFVDISEVDVEGEIDEQPSDGEEAGTGLLEILQEDEISEFNEEKILSDDDGQVFIEGDSSTAEDELPFREEEILPDNEELPKWLQRLIAESYPEDDSDRLYSIEEEELDEITKPVQITPPESLVEEFDSIEELEDFEAFEAIEEIEDFDLAEELEVISSMDEALPDEDVPIESIEEIQASDGVPPTLEDELEEDIESVEEFIFDDTQPVKLPENESIEIVESTEPEEPIEWSEEDNLYFNPENGYLIDIPEALQFARQVLIHGDAPQALGILRTYISEATYLDEIKIWLLEAAESGGECLSEIWESIGDIAVSQDKHQDALTAYSKAINYLLVNKDENGTC